MKTQNYFRYLLLLSLILLVNVTPVLAAGDEEKEIEELNKMNVIATRTNIPLENVPASVTVIGEEEIKEQQRLTVENLLRGQLGLDVVRNGPLGGQTSIFMRGAGSASTLVIIDGVQVNSTTAGNFNFGDLTVDNIERIEILRGPQSVQWGADAAGGVINIVTKKGRGIPIHSLTFEGGSYATFKEAFRSSGAIEKFDYSFSASHLRSSGFSSLNSSDLFNRGGRGADGTKNTTFSTRLGYELPQDTRAEFVGRFTNSQDEFDNQFGTDKGNWNNKDEYYLAVPLQKMFGGFWDAKLTPSYAYTETYTAGSSAPSKIFNRTSTIDIQNNLQLNRHFSFLIGGEYQNEQGVSVGGTANGEGFHEKIDNSAYFMQTIFDYQDRLVLTAGFRQDFNSAFDDFLTYKFEGGYLFPQTNTRFHTAYGKGFRAPTINDLFFPPSDFGSGPIATANPQLQPEEIRSFEFGVTQYFFDNRLKLGTTFFNSSTTNFIQLDANFVPQNLGKFRSKGLESEMDILLPYNLTLSIRHTWNDHAVDEPTKSNHRQPAIRRAKHKFNGSLQHNWNNKLKSMVSFYMRSKATDTSAAKETNPYKTIRAVFSYQISKNLELTMRGENLFNEDYEEVHPFGTPGISGYGGFTYTFD